MANYRKIKRTIFGISNYNCNINFLYFLLATRCCARVLDSFLDTFAVLNMMLHPLIPGRWSVLLQFHEASAYCKLRQLYREALETATTYITLIKKTPINFDLITSRRCGSSVGTLRNYDGNSNENSLPRNTYPH